jgi:hypothetical protein
VEPASSIITTYDSSGNFDDEVKTLVKIIPKSYLDENNVTTWTVTVICKMSKRTVRRICKEGKDSLKNEYGASEKRPMFRSPWKTYKRDKPLTELDDLNEDLVRRTVHEIYDRGEYTTSLTVKTEV